MCPLITGCAKDDPGDICGPSDSLPHLKRTTVVGITGGPSPFKFRNGHVDLGGPLKADHRTVAFERSLGQLFTNQIIFHRTHYSK